MNFSHSNCRKDAKFVKCEVPNSVSVSQVFFTTPLNVYILRFKVIDLLHGYLS
jgi:hypothetical protein